MGEFLESLRRSCQALTSDEGAADRTTTNTTPVPWMSAAPVPSAVPATHRPPVPAPASATATATTTTTTAAVFQSSDDIKQTIKHAVQLDVQALHRPLVADVSAPSGTDPTYHQITAALQSNNESIGAALHCGEVGLSATEVGARTAQANAAVRSIWPVARLVPVGVAASAAAGPLPVQTASFEDGLLVSASGPFRLGVSKRRVVPPVCGNGDRCFTMQYILEFDGTEADRRKHYHTPAQTRFRLMAMLTADELAELEERGVLATLKRPCLLCARHVLYANVMDRVHDKVVVPRDLTYQQYRNPFDQENGYDTRYAIHPDPAGFHGIHTSVLRMRPDMFHVQWDATRETLVVSQDLIKFRAPTAVVDAKTTVTAMPSIAMSTTADDNNNNATAIAAARTAIGTSTPMLAYRRPSSAGSGSGGSGSGSGFVPLSTGEVFPL